jgi:hypothetical protein
MSRAWLHCRRNRYGKMTEDYAATICRDFRNSSGPKARLKPTVFEGHIEGHRILNRLSAFWQSLQPFRLTTTLGF